MRRLSCFNTLLKIIAISTCAVALSSRYSHSGEIKFDQIKGDINWDDPKFLVEAQQNYQLAKEIQKDAKRRKQLRREGKTDEEVKEIMKKERAERENAKLAQFAPKQATPKSEPAKLKESKKPSDYKLQPADFGYSEEDEYANNLQDITVKTEINNGYDAYRSGYKDALADMGGYGSANYSVSAVSEPVQTSNYKTIKPRYKSVSAKNFTPPVPVLPSGRRVVVNENAFVRKYDNNFLAQKQREGYVALGGSDETDDGFAYEKVPASKRFVSSKKRDEKVVSPQKRTLYASSRQTNDNRIIKTNIQKEEAGAADFYDNDVSKYQITYDFTKSDEENDRLAHIKMPTVSYNGNGFTEFDRNDTYGAMYALTDDEKTRKIQQAMLKQSSQARKKERQAKKAAKKAKKQAEAKISKEEKALEAELKKYHEQKEEDAKNGITYTKDIQMVVPSKIEMPEIDKIEKMETQKAEGQEGNEDIIILNNDVKVGQTINLKKNGLTPAQIDAKNMGAPYPLAREDRNRLKQVLPQSIAQVSYDKNNRHLTPVVFENKVGEDIIKHFNDPNSVEFVRTFINNVGNVDIEDDDGNTLLMHAVANKHQSMIAMLLSEGANPNFKNKLGFTPMHLAASNGDNKAIHYLIMAGGNPNLRDNDGNTPFMYAAMMCNKETNKLMLDMGGDISMVNKLNKNKNILDYAYNNQDRSVQGFLSEKYKAAIRTKSKDLTIE